MRRKGLTWVAAILTLLFLLSGCGAEPVASPGLSLYTESGKDPGSWVRIPKATFPYGQHSEPTTIENDFEMMVTEVTNAQYVAYLEQALKGGSIKLVDGKIVGPYGGDTFKGGKHEERIDPGDYLHIALEDPASRITFDGTAFKIKTGYENHPVTMVSWFGAKAYCESTGGRLPTEPEWEYAARGTDGRPYPNGEKLGHEYANYYHSDDPFEGADGWSDTTPVGFYNGKKYGDFQTADSKSPFGLYDMAGNAGEWTGSIYDEQHYRYIRGGSKAQYEIDARVWYRNSATPTYVSPNVGFRCVRDVK